MENIAVLLTSYNRKGKTINCLGSLYKAIEFSNHDIDFDIYLVDDGSTDGTSKAVSMNFPEINVIKGSGNLFWAGGMRLAWVNALSRDKDYDAFLLLNDDVVLTANFLADILDTHSFCLKYYSQSGIYVSSTKDPDNLKISYGGVLIKNRGINIRKLRIIPSEKPVPCSMANANILMVTQAVVNKIGILDPKLIHRFADYDLTLTASKQGIPVLVCPGIGGYCRNDNENDWLTAKTSFKDRIKYLYSPKGLGYNEQIYYLKKHFKFQFPYYFIMLWLKTFFPVIWDRFKKKPE